MVLEILKDCSDFIVDDIILFVFSESIIDVEKDYKKKYINMRKREYESSNYSEMDVISLTQSFMEESYTDVIDLLNKTSIMLKRGKVGKDTFADLIIGDLILENQIIMNNANFSTSQVRLLNLSLSQLMHISYIDKAGNNKYLFDQKVIGDFIKRWQYHVERGEIFSRHTFLKELETRTFVDDDNKLYRDKLLKVIETRLSLLFSKMNAKTHYIQEFHPVIEKRSIFNWNYFYLYLEEIAGQDIVLDPEVVKRIRTSTEWFKFRDTYLACIACLQTKQTSAVDGELRFSEAKRELYDDIMRKHEIANKFNEIPKILRGEPV